jgi:hypothetical protein
VKLASFHFFDPNAWVDTNRTRRACDRYQQATDQLRSVLEGATRTAAARQEAQDELMGD